MATNLTNQVRSIAEVTKAVAQGDLTKTVNVDVQGEMLDLKMTVNSMVRQLATLAQEVSSGITTVPSLKVICTRLGHSCVS